jgi:hypothetical protein
VGSFIYHFILLFTCKSFFPSHSLEVPIILFFFLKVIHMFAFSFVGVFFNFHLEVPFTSFFDFTFVLALFSSKVYYLFLLFFIRGFSCCFSFILNLFYGFFLCSIASLAHVSSNMCNEFNSS